MPVPQVIKSAAECWENKTSTLKKKSMLNDLNTKLSLTKIKKSNCALPK